MTLKAVEEASSLEGVNIKERWGAGQLRVKEIERVLSFRLQRRNPVLELVQLPPWGC